jgi:hypothetical protein
MSTKKTFLRMCDSFCIWRRFGIRVAEMRDSIRQAEDFKSSSIELARGLMAGSV